MRVVLLRPALTTRKRRFLSCQFPLNICYLASYLRKGGHSVTIIDFDAGETIDSFVSALERVRPELVGFSCLTPNIGAGAKLAGVAKGVIPQCVTIVGGHHSSAIPERTLKEFPQFDLICIGEGEETVAELADAIASGERSFQDISGLAFRDGESVVRTSQRRVRHNLDSLPFPARDSLKLNNYRGQSHRGFSREFLRITEIITSRGCNWQCSFCAQHIISGGKRWARSAGNVAEEIRECVKRFGFNHFNICDDCFIERGDSDRAVAIAQEFRRQRVTFNCSSRVDAMTKELLVTLARCGLRGISFGVESGSPQTLREIGKGITISQIRDAVMWAKSARIPHVEVTAMLGAAASEGENEIRETVNLLHRLNPVNIMVSVAIPYPGTKLYEALLLAGKMSDKEQWDQFQFYDTGGSWQAGKFKASALSRLQRRIMRRFYLNPERIARRVSGIRSWAEAKYYISCGVDLIRGPVKRAKR
jgi:radical SAM superfamily enzyme YgiQ (UPF0313 family)